MQKNFFAQTIKNKQYKQRLQKINSMQTFIEKLFLQTTRV